MLNLDTQNQSPASMSQERDALHDPHGSVVGSLVWMGFLAILAGAIWMFIVP